VDESLEGETAVGSADDEPTVGLVSEDRRLRTVAEGSARR
jgi:hypothetical protein